MGSKKTTNVYYAPKAPAPSPVITSGRINSTPVITAYGSTTRVSAAPDLPAVTVNYNTTPNAWNTVPYVPSNMGVTTQSTVNQRVPAANASTEMASAISARNAVCIDLTTSSNALKTHQFTLVGNGADTKWAFSERGVPTNVTVYNASDSYAEVSSSAYTIVPRGTSFAWIQFDSAVASSTTYVVKYDAGDTGSMVNVDSASWSTWYSKINEVEQHLQRVQTEVNYTASTTTPSPGSWRLSDPTLVQDAITQVQSLRSAIKSPGNQMNMDQVQRICDNLNAQLVRINSDLTNTGATTTTPVSPVPEVNNTVPVSPPAVVSTSDPLVYDDDIRYLYFQGTGAIGEAVYSPPNSPPKKRVCRREWDPRRRRYYYNLNKYHWQEGHYVPYYSHSHFYPGSSWIMESGR